MQIILYRSISGEELKVFRIKMEGFLRRTQQSPLSPSQTAWRVTGSTYSTPQMPQELIAPSILSARQGGRHGTDKNSGQHLPPLQNPQEFTDCSYSSNKLLLGLGLWFFFSEVAFLVPWKKKKKQTTLQNCAHPAEKNHPTQIHLNNIKLQCVVGIKLGKAI